MGGGCRSRGSGWGSEGVGLLAVVGVVEVVAVVVVVVV